MIDIGMTQISKQLQKEWLELRGTVKVDGFYKSKRIVILDRYSLREKAVRYSSPAAGIWRWRIDSSIYPIFERENRFTAIAMDDTKIYNAIIFDYLSLYLINVIVNL